jgi:dihydrofolate reductase
MSSVSVFLAMSLDGYIAGEGGDLSWLPQGEANQDFGYGYFYASVGAILMGRNSYDAVLGLSPKWPYGDKPVLVASHRELSPAAETVIPVSGDISECQGLVQIHYKKLEIGAEK